MLVFAISIDRPNTLSRYINATLDILVMIHHVFDKPLKFDFGDIAIILVYLTHVL